MKGSDKDVKVTNVAMRKHLGDLPATVIRADQPLIGILSRDDGRDSVRSFADEAEADAVIDDATVADALSLAGAWADLDGEEMAEALDRIRHQSVPTPPIEL